MNTYLLTLSPNPIEFPPPVDFFGVTSRDLFCVCCIGEELITGTAGIVVIVDEEEEEEDGIGVFTRLSRVEDTGVCIIKDGSSVSRAEEEDLAGGRDGVFKPDEEVQEYEIIHAVLLATFTRHNLKIGVRYGMIIPVPRRGVIRYCETHPTCF